MNHREIEALITQYPIYQYAFVNTDSIEFTEKVRAICKRECPRYGRSWSCPPAVGSLDSCKNRCREFPEALFFSTVADTPDYSDMDRLLETKGEHERITGEIETLLRSKGIKCYTLSSDSCSSCEKCTYPKRSCRHPEQLHPCIESHGIVIIPLVEANQMDYYMGENMVIWFSMIFLGQESPKNPS